MTDSPAAAALQERVAAAIDRRRLLRGVDHLLIACSGGGDSVGLVELLAELAPRGLRLGLAHLDHGLRADGAERELLDGLARRHALPLYADTLAAGPGSEAAWRRARLSFLRRVAAEAEADAVAVGHTLDDQAETLLLNLARGTGRRGLGGMRARRRVDGLLILRPLLGVRRSAVRAFLRHRSMTWLDDPSNRDPAFARNRVRVDVVPALERALPGARAGLARAAELLADEEEWLDALAAEALAAARQPQPADGGASLSLASLRALPEPLTRRVVRAALEAVRGSLRGIDRRHIEAVVAMIRDAEATAHDLPGVRARIDGPSLRLQALRDRRVVTVAES